MSGLNDTSLVDLFRMEVETQSKVLTEGLLGLERQADSKRCLEELMRAAHSLKGAARIVGRKSAVRIAHAMEGCFVAAQKQKLELSPDLIDTLLQGTDFIGRIAQASEEGFASWENRQQGEIEEFLSSLTALAEAVNAPAPAVPPAAAPLPIPAPPTPPSPTAAGERPPAKPEAPDSSAAAADRVLRVTAESLNRLMGLAGEAMVASRWMETFAADLARLKHVQQQLRDRLDDLRSPDKTASNLAADQKWSELRDGVVECQQSFTDQIAAFERFDRRFLSFSNRLYHEVLDCRMRPFSDGMQGLHRMVRDVARHLGKQVRLEVTGEDTLVDRDILERIKAPLDHLLRNAIDHGIELPADRRVRGKPEEGVLHLQANHRAGMLLITVQDDGAGVDVEAVRKAIVAKGLTTLDTTRTMSVPEILEFLFLPGFTLKETASEISGRGVGLDIVQAMTKGVGGRVEISSQSGAGTRFQLELPLTLSLVRTLLVEIAGEPYAFPLARIRRALKLSAGEIETSQGRRHFSLGDEQIGIVPASHVLNLQERCRPSKDVSVILFGDHRDCYGLVIDRFLGERELVVRSLDPRLGKVRNISSAALLPDGSPVLIIDVDDLKRSIENLASGEGLRQLQPENEVAGKRKRVLVVDDSLTVRELERKLLESRGYAVDVAVDGTDGWNAVRSGSFDLVVTDIDMPRMDGIELLRLIRKEHRIKSLPVAIVSYKDRPEDRALGMEAGADYYLTKASFHDETLLRVVADLIGGANS